MIFTRFVFKLVFRVSEQNMLWDIPATSKHTQYICNFQMLSVKAYWSVYKDSHKKRKDSLETRAIISWILTLTWNFGGGPSNSALTFFKMVSADGSFLMMIFMQL